MDELTKSLNDILDSEMSDSRKGSAIIDLLGPDTKYAEHYRNSPIIQEIFDIASDIEWDNTLNSKKDIEKIKLLIKTAK